MREQNEGAIGGGTEHFATTNYFVIECVCGRIFSELTEERARQRFEDHHVAAQFTSGSTSEADQ